MGDRVAFRATVSGRVQGVGFRFNTRAAARRLGVAGWVRNEPDGTVTVHAEADEAALEALLAWLRHGPPGAHVTAVDHRPVEPTAATAFDVRF